MSEQEPTWAEAMDRVKAAVGASDAKEIHAAECHRIREAMPTTYEESRSMGYWGNEVLETHRECCALQSWYDPKKRMLLREETWTVAEAVQTKSFGILTGAFFCTWLLVFLPLVHRVIFALDIGLPRDSAILALSFLGGFSTLGRLTMGFVSDRIGRRATHGLNVGLQAFSWMWILGTHTNWMLYLFASAFGFSYGGVAAIFPSIVGDYFGRLKAASVIGAVFTLSGIAAAFGPLVGGYISDLTHTYRTSFILGFLTNILALILVFISRPPKKK